MKVPFLRALRHAFPNARVTWLTAGGCVYAEALAPLAQPFIDEVIAHTGIGGQWRQILRRPLKGRAFDIVIDTQRRVKTTLILRRIRHRVFISGAADFRFSDRKPSRPYVKKRRMVDAMLDLVTVAGGRKAELDTRPMTDALNDLAAEALLPAPDAAYIGLAPGAGGAHKRWLLENFIAVARALQEKGQVPVFLLGPAEHTLREAIAAALPGIYLPNLTHPLLTIALARRLKAAVANDSGTGHMLAAADVPLVSLFGPTDPSKFAPYVKRGIVLAAQDFASDSARADNMEAIPVAAVLQALESL